MEKNATSSLFKSTATYGTILGIILVIYTLALYIFDVMPIGFLKPILLGLISMVISIVGLVIFAKKVRNTLYPNEFPFGRAFVTCLLISLFAIVISTLYSYIQSTVIDPEYNVRLMEAQKEYMINFMTNQGVSEEQLEATINNMDESSQNPNSIGKLALGFLIAGVISAVISLIIAAIIKRDVKVFDQQ